MLNRQTLKGVTYEDSTGSQAGRTKAFEQKFEEIYNEIDPATLGRAGGSTYCTDKLIEFICREFGFPETRAMDLIEAHIKSKGRQVEIMCATILRGKVVESFPDEEIPPFRYFLMLKTDQQYTDLPLLNSLEEVRDEIRFMAKALELSMRWLVSRKKGFRLHPEFTTVPDLENYYRERYQCTTPGEIQRAIEEENSDGD